MKREGSFNYGGSIFYCLPISNVGNPIAPTNYGVSLFQCLLVSSNTPVSECLGAAWGTDNVIQMMRNAGFTNITITKQVGVFTCLIKSVDQNRNSVWIL